jgi:BspA type Leucine rich repeat region (6 copies)
MMPILTVKDRQEREHNVVLLEGTTELTYEIVEKSLEDQGLEKNDITELTLPAGVTHIGEGAFGHCRALKEVMIPAGVTHIGREAFSYCQALEQVIIPAGVIHIGEGAFAYCSSLEQVIIPEGVTHIRNYAFTRCGSLKFMFAPAGLDLSFLSILASTRIIRYSGVMPNPNSSYLERLSMINQIVSSESFPVDARECLRHAFFPVTDDMVAIKDVVARLGMLKLQGVDSAHDKTATRPDKLLAQKAVGKLQSFLIKKYQSIVLGSEAPSASEEYQACRSLNLLYPGSPRQGFGQPLVMSLWDNLLSPSLSDFLKKALLPKANVLTEKPSHSLADVSVLTGDSKKPDNPSASPELGGGGSNE